MDFSSAKPTREDSSAQNFDIEKFKTLLSDLKASKNQQEEKAKPAYDFEE